VALKSKFIMTTLFLSLVSSSIATASPSDLSPSARLIPSVCDVSNPSQPKGCVVKDFGALLRKQIETYVAFTNEKDPRYESEYKYCVARENKLLWEQYFGSFESNKSRFEFPQEKSITSAEYLVAMANGQLDWINRIEGYFTAINHDQVKTCLEFMVYSLNSDYGPIPEKNYKREWTADYYEIFAKYFIASEENMKVNPGNRRNLFRAFLLEVFAVYDTAGKQRIDQHLKLLSPIKAVAESAKLVASKEKTKIVTDEAKAAAQAKALADAQAKREAELQARAFKEAQATAAREEQARKKQDVADAKARAKILASGGCQYFGFLVKNGGSLFKGTRTCVNGKLSSPSTSGGSSGGSSGGKTLVSKTCTISTTGLTSDWNGAQYSWTFWNHWSDGSKTVASMGSGYRNVVPNGC
jgi:hypothetical protein